MKITWTPLAEADLLDAVAYIMQDNIPAAWEVRDRIISAAELLLEHPHSGRIGRVEGTRELVIAGTRYFLPYRVKSEEIEVLRVIHSARN